MSEDSPECLSPMGQWHRGCPSSTEDSEGVENGDGEQPSPQGEHGRCKCVSEGAPIMEGGNKDFFGCQK